MWSEKFYDWSQVSERLFNIHMKNSLEGKTRNRETRIVITAPTQVKKVSTKAMALEIEGKLQNNWEHPEGLANLDME